MSFVKNSHLNTDWFLFTEWLLSAFFIFKWFTYYEKLALFSLLDSLSLQVIPIISFAFFYPHIFPFFLSVCNPNLLVSHCLYIQFLNQMYYFLVIIYYLSYTLSALSQVKVRNWQALIQCDHHVHEELNF